MTCLKNFRIVAPLFVASLATLGAISGLRETQAFGQTLASNGEAAPDEVVIDAPMILSRQSLAAKLAHPAVKAPAASESVVPETSGAAPVGSAKPINLYEQSVKAARIKGAPPAQPLDTGATDPVKAPPPKMAPQKTELAKADVPLAADANPLILFPQGLKAESEKNESSSTSAPKAGPIPKNAASIADSLKAELTKFAQVETETPSAEPVAPEPVAKTDDTSETATPSSPVNKKKAKDKKSEENAAPPEDNSTPTATASAASVADQPSKKQAAKDKQTPLPDTLREVVNYAIKINPQIAIARGRLGEAKAGVAVAEANKGFQLDGNIGTGYGAQSTTNVALSNELFSQPALGNGKRYIVGLTGKKLIYDFGATDTGINRAMKLTTAEELNVVTRMNDVGQAMAQAYLMVVETRDLAKLNTENIKSLEEILELVKLNQSNGNGTIADVKRVEARLADARSVAADNEAEMQTAIDRFQRLVKSAPGELKPVPDLADYAPASVESALALLPQMSPKLRSDDALRRAAELDLDAKKSSLKPQVLFESSASMKSYTGSYWNNFDAQALVTLTYKFLDGGLSDGQIGQLSARIEQAQQQAIFDRDEAEADLRKFYVTLASARSKTASLDDGVDASRKAKDLYKEQFQGGKRSLFELLDIQTSAFNAERASIINRFEERRAVYGVLNTLGTFLSAINGKREPQTVSNSSDSQKDKTTAEAVAD